MVQKPEPSKKYVFLAKCIENAVRRKVSGCSLWVFCGAKTSIKTSIPWFVFFYLSSKRNRKFKHLGRTKPMGENTITNIMKVSVAGTSLNKHSMTSISISIWSLSAPIVSFPLLVVAQKLLVSLFLAWQSGQRRGMFYIFNNGAPRAALRAP